MRLYGQICFVHSQDEADLCFPTCLRSSDKLYYLFIGEHFSFCGTIASNSEGKWN